MHETTGALLRIYREPERALALLASEWSDLFGVMRRARCTGPMGVRLRQGGVMDQLHDRVQGQFETARIVAQDRRHLLRWELAELARALRGLDSPVIALKGAAYELQGLPFAEGRVPADVDLLVSPASLARAESVLKAAGWVSAQLDPYDERYYRDWAHEVPPLRHPERQIEVDLHHAITPERTGGRVDTSLLIDGSIAGRQFRVFSPVDQVLHCALHTFRDSDLDGRLREVIDFDQLVRVFGADDPRKFSNLLYRRADELSVREELSAAVRCGRRWLGTPAWADAEMATDTSVKPVRDTDGRGLVFGLTARDGLRERSMDALLDAAMLPGPHQRPTPGAHLAKLVLLTRYHLRRMPLQRLLPHLFEKTRRRWTRRN